MFIECRWFLDAVEIFFVPASSKMIVPTCRLFIVRRVNVDCAASPVDVFINFLLNKSTHAARGAAFDIFDENNWYIALINYLMIIIVLKGIYSHCSWGT